MKKTKQPFKPLPALPQTPTKKRFFVSVNEMELNLLNKLMADDAKTNVSSYFGYLISEVAKSRKEEVRSHGGRPRKEEPEYSLQNPNDTDAIYDDPGHTRVWEPAKKITAAGVLGYFAAREGNETISEELLAKMKANGHI